MIETISDTFDDIRETIGDKGFFIFIGVAVIFGIYSLVKGSSQEVVSDQLTPVTTISSYPDAVTNANVIIDTLQNSIAYSEGVIVDQIQGMGDDLTVYLDEHFEATNDYINSGLESQQKLMEENFDTIQGGLDSYEDIMETTKTGVSAIKGALSSIGSVMNATQQAVSATQQAVKDLGKQTTSKSTSSASSVKSSSQPATYVYKTKTGLNTGTSIVDALKATGEDSSMANRKKIAEANGIKNYTGTAQQNVELLNKLKSGDLKKV